MSKFPSKTYAQLASPARGSDCRNAVNPLKQARQLFPPPSIGWFNMFRALVYWQSSNLCDSLPPHVLAQLVEQVDA